MRQNRPTALRAASFAAIPAVLLILATACADKSEVTGPLTAPRAEIAIQATAHPIAVVSPFGCAVIRGGQVDRAAGSEIRIVQSWETKNQGLLIGFLVAQASTLSINGGDVVDLSHEYSVPTSNSDGYSAAVTYDTGIALAVGETMTFVFSIALSHRVHDGFTFADEQTHRPLVFGPGAAFEFVCTVTGA